ncbi:MAE_28990/MAE_18760 family HEPN-like nuclease [Paenibacillus sp. URB8-2]|uniref:MAE_28990/MAE_18760 family HEPN-like nuclease n=1 Tax=Paenibacillus sp. URB8-2 TaxID=2741301 RepID=UPI0015C0B688|nr:MAE_28990/MAE_18760 family HEPN-like nuclease [Paenibacillus sp. URB8-2]BCG58279.1 hypothetical protein PUR_17040 [Paenibacillus sp. URB8-2]
MQPEELNQLRFENLTKELEHERDWRVKEFALIKKQYLRYKREEFKKIFAKMIIPLLYAHWEGYCVSSFKLVLKFINEQKLSYIQITNNLFTYAHHNTYNYLKGKHSFEQRCKFSKNFMQLINQHEISVQTKIDTKANLKFEVLQEVCSFIGMSFEKFIEHKDDLDKLVSIRNAIAHGENGFSFDIDEITKNIVLVTNLMDLLLIESLSYIQEKKYLKMENT